MSEKNAWFHEIEPLHPEQLDSLAIQRIQQMVTAKLPDSAESEDIPMKKMTKRIRPLIFAAAAIGVGAVSMLAANAATGGAVFEKVIAYVNGVPTEVDARVVKEDENTVAYEFELGDVEDGEENSFVFSFEGDEDVDALQKENGLDVQLPTETAEDAE